MDKSFCSTPRRVYRLRAARRPQLDRKSTRLNSSHANISYAVFCLKKKSSVPEGPRAWIIQTARHKAIDRIRRRTRFVEQLDAYTAAGARLPVEASEFDPSGITQHL